MAAPDFRFQDKVDPVAAASLIRSKDQIEQDMALKADTNRRARVSGLLDAVKTGQEIAANMMALAEKRSEARGLEKAQNLMEQPAPTAEAQGLNDGMPFPVKPDPEVERNRDKELTAALLQASGKAGAKELLSAKLKAINPDAKTWQQSTIQQRGADGRLKTISVAFNTSDGKLYNNLTGEQISSETDLSNAPERGYAQGFRPAGFSADGKEVVAEDRTGRKFILGTGPDGEETREPYDGKVFPKLENVPTGLTDALSELNYSGTVLKEIAKTFNPDYVGPAAARVGKMTKYLDVLTDEQKVEFYGNVAEYKNALIKAITGAQMSEIEAKRIIQQLPDENASPIAFQAGLKRAYLMTQRRIEAKREGLTTGGYVTRDKGATSISSDELDAMFSQKLGKANKAAPAGLNVDMSAIEAEIKKRGLKK